MNRAIAALDTDRPEGPTKSPLGIELDWIADIAVVSLRGELEFATAPVLRQRLMSLMDQGTFGLVLDLGELDFIDSTGVGVLVAALKRARTRGGDLVVRSAKGSVAKVFELVGLTTIFDLDVSRPPTSGDPEARRA